MFTLEYAKNPQWASENSNSIILTVKWKEFNEEYLFCATSYDIYQHGVNLFNKAKAGDFGEVKAYKSVTQPKFQTQGHQTI